MTQLFNTDPQSDPYHGGTLGSYTDKCQTILFVKGRCLVVKGLKSFEVIYHTREGVFPQMSKRREVS